MSGDSNVSTGFMEGGREWKGEKEVSGPQVWDANPGSLNGILKAKENHERVLVFRQIRLVTENGLEGRDLGTSLVGQWLRLYAPNAGGPGSIPNQRTRSHMHATTKESASLN